LRIVIIGNGVAGVTCAFDARQRDSDAEITLISGETDYFFSRTALMYSYMDIMPRKSLEPFERGVYDRKRITRLREWVTDHVAAERIVVTHSGKRISYDKLVLAVGAAPNIFGWSGADEVKDGLVHFVSMQDLDECERLTPSTKEAVVVGGGLIGIELVECLTHHGVKVRFLVREKWYWPMAIGEEEATFVARHIAKHGVELALEEEMTRIDTDASGRVKSVDTSKGRTLPCQMLGIAAGVHPNIARISEWTDAPEMSRGIHVDRTLETSIPGVFACGDCAMIDNPGQERRLHETIWYSAKRQGGLVGQNLFGDAREYEPPLFFNSSKFFDIEYTTVGDIMRVPPGTMSIYLKHPKHDISCRIAHLEGRVIGFNMLGSRWNHEVLERWVTERRDPEWAMANLKSAQFDVEFGRANLTQLVRQDLPLGAAS
jgi:3-phenylpropionate/trans-cinnamate dioxygenase ferredoxin reductase subunit